MGGLNNVNMSQTIDVERNFQEKKYIEFLDNQQKMLYGKPIDVRKQLSYRNNPNLKTSVMANPF